MPFFHHYIYKILYLQIKRQNTVVTNFLQNVFSDLVPLTAGATAPSKTVTNHCRKKNQFYDVTMLWLRLENGRG